MAEQHFLARLGWLRAAVLGANDGILSTAGTILAVAAASGSSFHGVTPHAVIFAGLAAWIAGACSMACGEYASVSAQADTEATAIREELVHEHQVRATNGLGAAVVAGETIHLSDPMGVLRDASVSEAAQAIGLGADVRAKPLQAAIASALSFSAGAAFPIAITLLATSHLIALVALATLVALICLGGFSAWLSGGRVRKTTARVSLLGVMALIITLVVGRLAGIVV